MTLTFARVVEVLLLLLAANAAPVLAARVLGARWARPIDHGRILRDGRPLFGTSKTWRGLAVGLLATAVAAWLLGFDVGLGVLFGAASLLGDLLSSFMKRRLGVRSSGRAVGLDQIPEALLPLLVCRAQLELDGSSIALLVAFFFVGSLLLSRAAFLLGIKKEPY